MNADNDLTSKICDFLNQIGIETVSTEIEENTFLPGIKIIGGVLTFDPAKLLYPGDLLHEAGHLAIMLPERRKKCCGDVGKKAFEEITAIAWSYAAIRHLNLDAEILFHPAGYKGSSAALIENFADGRYIGVPVLEWLGMSSGEKKAAETGLPAYPQMIKWVL